MAKYSGASRGGWDTFPTRWGFASMLPNCFLQLKSDVLGLLGLPLSGEILEGVHVEGGGDSSGMGHIPNAPGPRRHAPELLFTVQV